MATTSALSQWRCMRSGRVSEPVRIRNALKRRDRRADVAQAEDAAGDGEGEIAESLVQHHAAIFRARLRQHRIVAGLRPVERAAIHDDAAHRIAMAADELRQRMHDDVGAIFDRPDEIGRRQRVVDDQRKTMLVRDFGDGLDVDELAAGIGKALDEDGAWSCRRSGSRRSRHRRCRPSAPPSRSS